MNYLVADDAPLAHDLKWWAVLRTRAVDELTGRPPRGAISLVTGTTGCVPRVGDDGLCGLVARPRSVSEQMLAQGGLSAEIRAEGYLPRSLTAAIDAARRTTPMASTGDVALESVSPPEPPSPAPRRQFRPGRGVMLETPTAGQPHWFTLHGDPAMAPERDDVPLAEPVPADRPGPGPWRVAGVPIVLPDQPLHRAQPAIVRGRALRQPATNAALIDARSTRLGLVGVWRTFREIPGNSAPTHPADLVAFAAPLAFDRASGTLARRTARTPDGTARALAAPAAAGVMEIELDNVNALAPGGGDILELEASNSPEREIVASASFVQSTGTTRGRVRLATPLAFPHAAAAPVMRVTLVFSAIGPLAREAQRGDRVLFASTLVNVQTDDVLLVAGGTAPAELRFVRRFPLYDAGAPPADRFKHEVKFADDGSFALPPISRVAQVRLFVEHAGQAVYDPIDVVPDYGGDTTLQIIFKP
jgi:hypothetical protein